jgi:nucleotide-binding universal stress UspA family protein
MFDTILVPLDGSKLAEAILPYVKELASKLGARVTLLTAVETQYFVHPAAGAIPDEPATKAVMLDAERYLRTVAEDLKATVPEVNVAVEVGDAASVIVDYAKEKGMSLIAMSTHGRTGVGRWLLGSVTDKVVHWASVPVLVFRSPVAK